MKNQLQAPHGERSREKRLPCKTFVLWSCFNKPGLDPDSSQPLQTGTSLGPPSIYSAPCVFWGGEEEQFNMLTSTLSPVSSTLPAQGWAQRCSLSALIAAPGFLCSPQILYYLLWDQWERGIKKKKKKWHEKESKNSTLIFGTEEKEPIPKGQYWLELGPSHGPALPCWLCPSTLRAQGWIVLWGSGWCCEGSGWRFRVLDGVLGF